MCVRWSQAYPLLMCKISANQDKTALLLVTWAQSDPGLSVCPSFCPPSCSPLAFPAPGVALLQAAPVGAVFPPHSDNGTGNLC